LITHFSTLAGRSGSALLTQPAENPLFRLVPNRFGKATRCLHSSNNTAPIPEVRFKFNPDGMRDGGVHQLRVSGGHSFPSSRTPASPSPGDIRRQSNHRTRADAADVRSPSSFWKNSRTVRSRFLTPAKRRSDGRWSRPRRLSKRLCREKPGVGTTIGSAVSLASIDQSSARLTITPEQ